MYGQPKETRICPVCKNSFIVHHCRKKRFCSCECAKRYQTGEHAAHWQGGGRVYICRNCKQGFRFKKSVPRIFCSASCQQRYQRLENHPLWGGGKVKNSDGHMQIRMPSHPHAFINGYVFEHRIVMEKHLNRYLDPREVVHHNDNNKTNNAIGNLTLFKDNSEHMKYHQRVNRVRGIKQSAVKT